MPLPHMLRPGDVLAGYRVIEQLGTGSCAEAWRAELLSSIVPGAQDAVALVSPLQVALKVFPPSAAAATVLTASMDTEVDALCRGRSDHVVRLIDLSVAPGRHNVLVLELLSGGSLADLIVRRERFRSGECVTILSSVIRAIDDLHRAGVAHGHLADDRVLFDGAGRPVLVGFGHSSDAFAAEGDDSFGADLAYFASLCSTLLSMVDDDGREDALVELREWFGVTHAQAVGESFAALVEDRLFAFSQPLPISLTREQGLPERRHQSAGSTGQVPAAAGRDSFADVARGRVALAKEMLVATIDASPGVAVRRRMSDFFQSHRRPVIASGALCAVLLFVVLATVPVTVGDDSELSLSRSSDEPHTPDSDLRTSNESAGSTVDDSESAVEDSPESADASFDSAAGQTPRDADVVAGDDPVSAASSLLVRRQHCLTTASASCLKLVNQAGSPLFEADQLLIGSEGNNNASTILDLSDHSVSVVDRSGNSALVALAPPAGATAGDAKPASALMIKGEAGWRLREIFEN